ncbi:MAG: DUF4031 domain-containing protein [Alphaproteobacteria bacterium]
MAVYVDRAMIPYRGHRMCHMVADSREELDEMAVAIGLRRRWIQKAGTPHEHYDVTGTKRAEAVALGAVEIDRRALGLLLRAKREAMG